MTAVSYRDRHCHPLFAGREARAVNVNDCRSTQELVSTLQKYLRDNPDATWIDAASYDLAQSLLPTHLDLDSVSAHVPISVHTKDHHTLWVNSAALRLAHLDQSIPELAAGGVQVDDQSRPTGLLFEWEAMSLVLDKMPAPDLEDDIQSLLWADARLTSENVTSATDAWIDAGMAEVYFEASTRGLLAVRYELNVRVSPDAIEEQFDYLAGILKHANEHGDKLNGVNVAGIKIFLDGVISSRTAALLGSYRDGSNGNLIWSNKELENLLKRLAEVSPTLRPHFHAIGDAAVRQALDVIRAARASGYWTGNARPVIAHAELISDSDLPRFAELDVEVVVSPQWLAETPERMSYIHLLTDSDFARLGDFTGLLAHDAHLSYGSDWPVSLPDPEQARKHAIDYVQLRSKSQTMNKSEILTKIDAIFTS